MGSELFDSIIDTKIKPISGNLISPDLSLSDRESITDQVNIVIHCAATIDYNERLDLALEVSFFFLCFFSLGIVLNQNYLDEYTGNFTND
jgi:hypothetical protein